MANIHLFETILDHLDSILGKCSDLDSQYADQGMLSDSQGIVRRLGSEFRLVRTAYMCITKLGKGVERCESAGLLIQDALPKCAPKIQSLCLQYFRDDQLDFNVVNADLESSLSEFIKSIQFTPKEIDELYLICSTSKLLPSSLGEDHVLDLINSLLENLQDLRFLKTIYLRDVVRNSLDDLDQNVRFLKSLIHFASLRGLHHSQMEHLFTLAQGFLLNASLLTFMSLKEYHFADFPGEISKLLRTMKPIEPRVHEIYVRVLLASKASPSSHTPTITLASCKAILVDFIDSLNHKILELLNCGSDCLASFKYQMLRLRQALVFLKAIMREQQNKFYDLYETRHDFIGVVICESGIVICSLFMESNEQGLVKDLDSMFSHAFNEIKLIKALADEINPITSELSFPQTNMPGLVDSVLEKLKSFSLYEANSVALAKDQFQTVQKGLVFLKSTLGDVKVQGEQKKKLQTLWSRVAGAAYQMEFILDSLVVGVGLRGLLVLLNSITEEIKLVQTEALTTFSSKGNMIEVQNVLKTSGRLPSVSATPLLTDHVVGFDDEAKEIIHKLQRGTRQLDIISIVGMAGIGKTTLAKKIYGDPSISKHFGVRSWCTISQEYNKNDLLYGILQHIVSSKVIEKNKDDLAQLLYRCLKGKTYLIILDDVWDCGAWSDLQISFPNDGNQSRVLLTSRNSSVPLQIRPGNEPHTLRFLNIDESWELLQKKVFHGKDCPQELCDHGKRIAEKCKGLPLTIVLVAGILANTEPDTWYQVEDHLSEVSVDKCKEEVLELSYCHLPEYLKPCFLYFGIFREDQQVHVRDLLWLWIAEGFMEKSEKKCLESVAKDYMMELIQRNLVIIAEKSSTSGVRTCIVHDLIREFCVAKGKEEHFWYWLRDNDEPNIVHRLCLYGRRDHYAIMSGLVWPYLRSLILINAHEVPSHQVSWYDILYICGSFKLIRVLDLREIGSLDRFPSEIELFVHLRYLAITCLGSSIPSSVGKLSNLETLILLVVYDRAQRIMLPETLWDMKKLRHLCVKYSLWRFPQEDLQEICSLENLQTLSWAVILTSEKVLQKFPHLQKLKCKFHTEDDGTWNNKIITLDFMDHLESLHLDGRGNVQLNFQFPLNLKKLVLSHLNLPWSKIPAIANLPNLEVLKLEERSFVGDAWDMEDLQFINLKYLKVESLNDLIRWTGSEDHFPCLEKLVLRKCQNLEELPSCLGDITTLEVILVHCCSCARSSMEEIHQVLVSVGNETVKVLLSDD